MTRYEEWVAVERRRLAVAEGLKYDPENFILLAAKEGLAKRSKDLKKGRKW